MRAADALGGAPGGGGGGGGPAADAPAAALSLTPAPAGGISRPHTEAAAAPGAALGCMFAARTAAVRRAFSRMTSRGGAGAGTGVWQSAAATMQRAASARAPIPVRVLPVRQSLDVWVADIVFGTVLGVWTFCCTIKRPWQWALCMAVESNSTAAGMHVRVDPNSTAACVHVRCRHCSYGSVQWPLPLHPSAFCGPDDAAC